jgi:transposase
MKKTYTNEFKEQILELFNSGVRQHELMKQFKLPKSTIRDWRKQYSERGSFVEKENLSPETQELKKLRNELKLVVKEKDRLELENKVLKHVALILGVKK